MFINLAIAVFCCSCTSCGSVVNNGGTGNSDSGSGTEQGETEQSDDNVCANGHTLVHHEGKEATCTVDGWEEYDTCENCDYTTYEVIKAKGHALVHHEGKEETCTEDGWKEYDTCENCDYTTYEKIIGGHNYVDAICTRCKNSIATDGLVYELINDDTEYRLVGLGTSNTCDTIVVPGKYNGKNVTDIAIDVFQNNTYIKTLSLPSTIATIPSYLLSGCSSLEELTIPYVGNTREKDINRRAFGIIFGSTSYTGSKELKQKFYDVAKNTYVSTSYFFPENLKKVTVLGGYLSEYAFYNCKYLESIVLCDDVKLEEKLVFQYCNGLKEITLPKGLTSIPKYTFYACTSLTEIDIPEGVEIIEEDAIKLCHSLKILKLPSTLKTVEGSFNFVNEDYYSLNFDVYIDSLEHWLNIGNFSPSSWYYDLYINNELLTDLVIPENVTEIRKYAFTRCTSIRTIVIPDTITKINEGAFYGCENIKSVSIGSGIENIPKYCFLGASYLHFITIPETVKTIEKYAFTDCHLNRVELNKSTTTYDAEAFSDCYTLFEIGMEETKIVNVDNCLFYNINDINFCIGYIGDPAELVLPDTFNGEAYSIYSSAFRGLKLLRKVVISDNINSIWEDAFAGCNCITEISLPKSIGTIEKHGLFFVDLGIYANPTVTFRGTIEEWENCSYRSNLTLQPIGNVQCTDGEASYYRS